MSKGANKRKIGKHDVEFERIRRWYNLADRATTWIGISAAILVSTLPLSYLVPVIDSVSGKETDFRLTIGWGAGWMFVVGGLSVRLLVQRKSLKRQRRQIKKYEVEFELRAG